MKVSKEVNMGEKCERVGRGKYEEEKRGGKGRGKWVEWVGQSGDRNREGRNV